MLRCLIATSSPPWLSWLERQSHNLEVVSSILTGGSRDIFRGYINEILITF